MEVLTEIAEYSRDYKMYPGKLAKKYEDRPAFIMASTGETVTYKEFEARSNQLAHFFREEGLKKGDHYSVFMENNNRYLESNSAGERAGLIYTCINSYLKDEELAYILVNSDAKILITSISKLDIVETAAKQCTILKKILVVGAEGKQLPDGMYDFVTAISRFPTSPIPDENLGAAMLYSSGTTGRPKGILRPLPDQKPDEPLPIMGFLSNLWNYSEDMIYLSPAPLYHSAPQAANSLAIRKGATTVIMEKFEPLEYLSLIEKYSITHSQLVPTMFSRMLKLSDEEKNRFDLSSLKYALHAAAPCPEQVKRQMIEWWGPIICEYYGATEAFGFAYCDTKEWLEHPGTVGKIMIGELTVMDDEMKEMPVGEPGTLWFKPASEFNYHKEPEKTAEAYSADKSLTTVGDVGYLDEDGFLYLTDRKAFMIISGGVNIYPQECEDLLISHPKVFDAAVFGVPNQDLGEEVKAVVQPVESSMPKEDLAGELLEYLHANLSRQKVPRSIDFVTELPRLPTGKLYKRVLRDKYWGEGKSRIIQE